MEHYNTINCTKILMLYLTVAQLGILFFKMISYHH